MDPRVHVNKLQEYLITLINRDTGISNRSVTIGRNDVQMHLLILGGTYFTSESIFFFSSYLYPSDKDHCVTDSLIFL